MQHSEIKNVLSKLEALYMIDELVTQLLAKSFFLTKIIAVFMA